MARRPKPQAPRKAYPAPGAVRYDGRWPTLRLSRRTAQVDGVATLPVARPAPLAPHAWFPKEPARLEPKHG